MVGFGETDWVGVGCEGVAMLVRRLVVSVNALDVAVVAVSGVTDSVVVFV